MHADAAATSISKAHSGAQRQARALTGKAERERERERGPEPPSVLLEGMIAMQGGHRQRCNRSRLT